MSSQFDLPEIALAKCAYKLIAMQLLFDIGVRSVLSLLQFTLCL